MKCTQCGNKTFIKTTLEGPTDDGWWKTNEFIPYVCKQCGHVEFFLTEASLNSFLDKEKEDLKEQQFNKEKELKIKELTEQIKKLNNIINDEENSLRIIKTAQSDLVQKKEELRKLQFSKYQRKDGCWKPRG